MCFAFLRVRCRCDVHCLCSLSSIIDVVFVTFFYVSNSSLCNNADAVVSVVYSLSGSRLTRFGLGGAARAALHSAQLRFTLT